MILRRLGNKTALAAKLQEHFPPHDVYMEPFFGAGGMYFHKPKVQYNFLNDLDSDVYNLYRAILDDPEGLRRELEVVPIHEQLFKEWAKGKQEATVVHNAVRFLVLSNFGLYGKPDTMRIGTNNSKQIMLDNITPTLKALGDCYFLNCDFREFFKRMSYDRGEDRYFCYADPPYLDTVDNYMHSFTEQDSVDLFDVLQGSGIRWAMSEFDHPFILEQAQARGLNVHYVNERRSLKKRDTEILVTNYITPQLTLFT